MPFEFFDEVVHYIWVEREILLQAYGEQMMGPEGRTEGVVLEELIRLTRYDLAPSDMGEPESTSFGNYVGVACVSEGIH